MKISWQRSASLFIFCSIFLHILTWLGLRFAPDEPSHRKNEQIEITIHEAKAPSALPQQIVQQDKPINNDIDENAKFLSAFNQKVLKQTRAKDSGEFQNTTSSGAPKDSAQQPIPEEKTAQPQRRNKALSLSDITPQFKVRPPTPGQGGSANSPQAQSQTDDYLKDVETGMQTMLSSREFVYYSYYARIKERIKQHWEPSIREKVRMVFKTGRTIASTKDHITQVVVTLNKKGELTHVEVITPSGIVQLDQAAVEAFRAAQPFPNPPQGLIEEDGQIRIRWDFVLEANNGYTIEHDTLYARGGQ